jgi:hypothetical protein
VLSDTDAFELLITIMLALACVPWRGGAFWFETGGKARAGALLMALEDLIDEGGLGMAKALVWFTPIASRGGALIRDISTTERQIPQLRRLDLRFSSKASHILVCQLRPGTAIAKLKAFHLLALLIYNFDFVRSG